MAGQKQQLSPSPLEHRHGLQGSVGHGLDSFKQGISDPDPASPQTLKGQTRALQGQPAGRLAAASSTGMWTPNLTAGDWEPMDSYAANFSSRSAPRWLPKGRAGNDKGTGEELKHSCIPVLLVWS